MSTVQPQHPVLAETAAAPGLVPAPAAAASPAGVPVGAPQRFRGRTLEALLPQIRAALGPDAIVLRRREGLTGGVGGFFQQRFVEVEAVAGQPAGFDAYDDAPAWPEDVSADGVRWLEDGTGNAAPSAVAGSGAAAHAVAAGATRSGVAGATDGTTDLPGAAPFLAAAAAGTPIDGAAFLRHLDEAVERRNALAPGATDEAFESEPPARGLLAREDVVPEVRRDEVAQPHARDGLAAPADAPHAPTRPSGRGTVAAYARAGVAVGPDPTGDRVVPAPPMAAGPAPEAPAPPAVTVPAAPVLATFPRVASPASRTVPATTPAPAATIETPVVDAGSSSVAVASSAPWHRTRALGRRTALPAPLTSADLVPVGADAPTAGPTPRSEGPTMPSQVRAGGPATTSSEAPSRAPRPAAPRPVAHLDVEVAVPERSSVDADVAEYGLIARGLSPAVARSVVLEAAAHGQPLDAGHRIDRATRAALARRIPQTAPRGGVRTMVVVGAPGAGCTSAVGALATAHARAGRRVLAVAMDAADGGAALAATLVGTDAELLVATGGATAAAAIRVARPDVCVVDTPAVHPSDTVAVEALAVELRALGADEVHLALPGTDQTTAALGALDGLEPLRPDALLMTHRDRAERPGGVVGASIVRGLPIAYVTDGRAVALAEPARLARMVQP